MRVVWMSRSTKHFYTLAAKCITTVDLTMNLLDGLAWPMLLWTHSTRLYGVTDAYADRQVFEFSSRLFYCIGMRL